QGSMLSPVILNDICKIPISLNDTNSEEILGFSVGSWITKLNKDSLSGYYTKYYYSRFEVPRLLGIHDVTFNSLGTPIFDISFITPPTFSINVIQESLSEDESIYLSNDYYELEYGNSLRLEGAILDNDEYMVEDEVYDYRYTEALDGTTSHQLNIIARPGDDEFIDKEEFTIYYINDNLEKLALFSSLNNRHYKDNTILDFYKDPVIGYVDNAYILNIYWLKEGANFINYDTNLLISYKVIKGRPISPISFSSSDSYGNDKQQNLVEIPFTKYDMLTQGWITQDTFTQQFRIDEVFLLDDFAGTTTTIQGPIFDDGQIIQTGIINLDSVYENRTNSDRYELLDKSEYSWIINANGELEVSGLPFITGDEFKIAYNA
ncbi:hypothetical protein LCGC14_2946000, partial [marine sediment metagenome]